MNPLAAICNAWLDKQESSAEHKKENFSVFAEDAMKFYAGDHDFMYQSQYMTGSKGMYGDMPNPSAKVTVNKVFELVTIYLTYLMHRNPNRTVSARIPTLPDEFMQLIQQMQMMQMPVDPMTGMQQPPPPSPFADPVKNATAQAAAWLMQWVLNQTPYEYDLKGNGRKALVEALMKGRGIMWCEIIERAGRRIPSSQYDSVDYLFIDPDHELVKDAAWVMRERTEYVHSVEDRFRLERGSLPGNLESKFLEQHYKRRGDKDSSRKLGVNMDMIRYYEVYSRIGMGGRLSGPYSPLSEEFEQYGKNCYLVIAKGVEYPLNIGPDVESLGDTDYVAEQTRWPIPTHDDHAHPWPFAYCDFADQPRCVWPVAWIRPAIGMQKLLGWMYSYMASHISVASRNFMVVDGDIEEEIEERILNGDHFELLKFKTQYPKQWQDFIGFIKHEGLISDWWTILVKMEMAFDKSTGLTELMYGFGGAQQMRSAEEASIREEHTMMRPDDMANQVEDFMGQAARNEAIAWRALTEARDVAPLFNETFTEEEMDQMSGQVMPAQYGPYTTLWTQLLLTKDVDEVLSEFDYRIEAGSVRKPNKAKMRQDIDESAQVVFPALMQDYMKWGDAAPVNAWLREWAKARDMEAEVIQLPDRQQQIQQQQMMMQQQAAMKQGGPPGGPPQQGGEGPATIPMGA